MRNWRGVVYIQYPNSTYICAPPGFHSYPTVSVLFPSTRDICILHQALWNPYRDRSITHSLQWLDGFRRKKNRSHSWGSVSFITMYSSTVGMDSCCAVKLTRFLVVVAFFSRPGRRAEHYVTLYWPVLVEWCVLDCGWCVCGWPALPLAVVFGVTCFRTLTDSQQTFHTLDRSIRSRSRSSIS